MSLDDVTTSTRPAWYIAEMGGRKIEQLFAGGHYFESPRWKNDRWWVSDVYGHTLYAITPDGEAQTTSVGTHQPSGLGWLPDGSLLVVSMLEKKILRVLGPDDVELYADLSAHVRGDLNDMVVDERGRAWVGSTGFDLLAGEAPVPSTIIRVDMDKTPTVVAEGLMFPNGAVITPEAELIVGETLAAKYTAFAISEDGTLGERREWASLPQPFGPDGCTLDQSGAVWSADALGHRCVRVGPGGKLLDTVEAPPGLAIFAAALGGTDGRDLLLCAAPSFDPVERNARTDAVLLTVRVDTAHAGCP